MRNDNFKLGELTYLGPAEHDGYFHKQGYFKCFCGKEFIASMYRVKTGGTKSCGCYHKHIVKKTMTTHGLADVHPLYSIWMGMKNRCRNKNGERYKDYGGRGIVVCNEWKDFTVFKKWADENGYSEELTIDRANNDKGYSPDNCRWVTQQIQTINRRTPKTNTSGIIGVSYREGNTSNPWYARIQINKKQTCLGFFPTKEEASAVYQQAKKERDELYFKEFEQIKNQNKK